MWCKDNGRGDALTVEDRGAMPRRCMIPPRPAALAISGSGTWIRSMELNLVYAAAFLPVSKAGP